MMVGDNRRIVETRLRWHKPFGVALRRLDLNPARWLGRGLGMAAVVVALTSCGVAQPPMRRHSAIQKSELKLVEADQRLRYESKVEITESNGYREIRVNSIPKHSVGRFPNRGNPHSIEQRVATFRVPLKPRQSRRPSPLRLGLNFGIGVNGVLFDPGAAEFWMGNPQSGWQYEALGGAVPLGLDTNYAHVQPDGKYHYHGIPTGLLKELGVDDTQHSPLIGWAADGFPIYAITGYQDPQDMESGIEELEPSYRLKQGQRPGGNRGQNAPGGVYDGTFVNDYEFIEGLGDLDECNGRFGVTPEYPEGIYAYFLTHHWPSVPRMHRGTPDASFQNRMGPPGRRGFRPPPGGRRPSE